MTVKFIRRLRCTVIVVQKDTLAKEITKKSKHVATGIETTFI